MHGPTAASDASANHNDGSCYALGASMSWRATSTRANVDDGSCCTSTIAGSVNTCLGLGRRWGATMWTTAWANLTPVAFATAPAPCSVGALLSPGDCDCNGSQLDALGVWRRLRRGRGGDGVCDVDDDCVGQYDACGICNGPGQVYECGCANMPAGDYVEVEISSTCSVCAEATAWPMRWRWSL